MKKLLLFASSLLFVSVLIMTSIKINAQTLELVTSDPVTGGSRTEYEVVAYGQVKNMSANDNTYRVRISAQEIAFGHTYAFCDPNTCYAPTNEYEWEAFFNFNLSAGQSTIKEENSLHLYPNNYDGKSVFDVTIFNINDASDNVTYTHAFFIDVSSIPYSNIYGATIGIPYPNPANEFFNLAIDIPMIYQNSKLELINSEGNIVLSQAIENSTIAIINVANLNSGVYYYTVSTSSAKSHPKMLVISR